MHRMTSFVFCAAAALLCAGCNSLAGMPQIKDARVEPETPRPGDTVWLLVQVKDKHNVVARVEGVLVSDTAVSFPLHDDGTNGDETAGDGLWTLQVLVPPQIPPGEFELEFTAYRDDGLPVEVRTKDKKVVPLSEKLMVVVEALPESSN